VNEGSRLAARANLVRGKACGAMWVGGNVESDFTVGIVAVNTKPTSVSSRRLLGYQGKRERERERRSERSPSLHRQLPCRIFAYTSVSNVAHVDELREEQNEEATHQAETRNVQTRT